ncbi:rod shape-determining protein MreD [Rickettsiella grylli]|uniref:rod shape-determining protein MreD n=1 Tax=Rickettsiella grylli TaxID=59196 RepID=UPI0008FD4B51|nr:rod shape-determining protein MreD [Rickettsiella grylli]OJA00147.1 rod shape-determining protein MreD [Rickettsiella grylli]
MRPLYFSTLCVMVISFSGAILLNILPLSPMFALFFPLWLPLVLIYWIMVSPGHIHFTLAWLLGLFIDVLYGSYLGEHSLALCVVAYLAYRFHLQFRMFPVPQQMLFVFVMLIIYQTILIVTQAWLGFVIDFRWVWISLLMSALIWPLITYLLRINPLEMRH